VWRKKLTWQLLAGYLGVMLLPLLVATWHTSNLYKKHYIDQVVTSEKTNGYLMSEEIAPLLAAREYSSIDALCKRFSRDIGMRVTVVLPDGRVIGDSEKDPDSMENHRYRPEIIAALELASLVQEGHTHLFGQTSLFFAAMSRKSQVLNPGRCAPGPVAWSRNCATPARASSRRRWNTSPSAKTWGAN